LKGRARRPPSAIVNAFAAAGSAPHRPLIAGGLLDLAAVVPRDEEIAIELRRMSRGG
jgi:hypothetical protein